MLYANFVCGLKTFTGSKSSDSYPSSVTLSCQFGQHQQLSNGTTNDYCIDSMPKQQQQQNHGNTIVPLSLSTDNQDIIITTTTTNTNTMPPLLMSLTKKRGIFPKPATNIMRAWLFHHLTGGSHVVFPGDESLSMCGSLNDDGGRESVLSEGNTGSGGGSATGANKRKVPKVFSKEAITKFRAWLFQNLTVSFRSSG
ncbi:unnamed protein product [Wuchereria bancrofti]|uniref:Uncharacterized protein n=1 Tax=Wuchereria bancrofti TaxID=6293 RepID=A0A3P7DUK6_WUCBA|nr:unnamed protein product [Wuchereria bancrofti]